MSIRPIHNETDYDKALDRVDTLMEPDPIEAIKLRMEQMHLKQQDLIPYIGNKSKVSEVLNRKVGLSLNMIYNLAKGLHLPLEVLVQPVGKMKVG